MIHPFDIEHSAAALHQACSSGVRDAVLAAAAAAAAAAQDDGLDLAAVLARASASWPGIAMLKRPAGDVDLHVGDTATFRGWLWECRDQPTAAFEPRLTATQSSFADKGLAAAVAAVAKSISEMDLRGGTPDDVRSIRLARATRELAPEARTLATLLAGRPSEPAAHAKLLSHTWAGIRKVARRA